MSQLTLTEIVDYGTIGGRHLAGRAIFSDGKQYRFVMMGDVVERMAIVSGIDSKVYGAFRTPFPVRAQLIIDAHAPYLEKAIVEKRIAEAERLRVEALRIADGSRRRILSESAEEMLLALKEALTGVMDHDARRMAKAVVEKIDAELSKPITLCGEIFDRQLLEKKS